MREIKKGSFGWRFRLFLRNLRIRALDRKMRSLKAKSFRGGLGFNASGKDLEKYTQLHDKLKELMNL